MSNVINRKPPAKRLINSMRSMGYTFSTSLADIIDNSISAKAKNVHVYYNTFDDKPYLEIIDDGYGMTRDELINALTFGSDKEYDEEDLGRFGLGLKSASLAQCRNIQVTSKKDGKIICMGYELDHIERTDDWDILEYIYDEIIEIPNLDKLKVLDTGTIVRWEDFDFIRNESRIEEYSNNLRKIIVEAQKHVALVFHRYCNEVPIYFNDERIQRRDPFLIDSKPRQITGISNHIQTGGHTIVVTPYTLPYANSLSLDEKKLLGLENGRSLYDDQGFYIYRNKRLIIWGSWLRMNSKSEFNKLARIQVDIPSALDFIWSLDVKKSTAKIPDFIRNKIKVSVLDSKGKSERVIKRPGKLEKNAENKLWLRKEFGPEEVSYELNRENSLYEKISDNIEPELKAYFMAYVKEIENNLPKFTIRDDMEENYKIRNQMAEGRDELEEQLIKVLLETDASKRIMLLDFLVMTKPYNILVDGYERIKKRVL